MDDPDTGEDDQARSEAIRFMAKRLLIWLGPLVLVGILLVALGLPVWVVVIAVAAALAIVVFELDL